MPSNDPLRPPAALLAKIGSIVVHATEYLSDDGHEFDRQALLALIGDADVAAWLASMSAMALVPVPRTARPTPPEARTDGQ